MRQHRGFIQASLAAGVMVHYGYVDDPRNTDNAWMETKALHVHWQPLVRHGEAHLLASLPFAQGA